MSPGDLDFHSEYPKHAISDVFFKQINDDCNGTKETACCFQEKKEQLIHLFFNATLNQLQQ